MGAGGSGQHLLAERRVRDPRGREWRIGIRWLPRRPRWLGWGFRRRRRRSAPDSAGNRFWLTELPDVGDGLTALAVVIVVVAALAIAWFLVLPIVLLVVDVLVVAFLAAGAVCLRVLFRRPWTIEATTVDTDLRWGVVGYRAARRAVAESADMVQRGLVPGPTVSSSH